MAGFRLKISASALWLLAAASLLVLEVRATSTRVPPPANGGSHINEPGPNGVAILGDVGANAKSSSVLVLGNLGDAEDGEIEITLRATPLVATGRTEHAHLPANYGKRNLVDAGIKEFYEDRLGVRKKQIRELKANHEYAMEAVPRPNQKKLRDTSVDPTVVVPSSPIAMPGTQPVQRVYFLPKAIQRESEHVAVTCCLAGENRRALIYIDQRLALDDALTELVATLDSLSSSSMVDTMEKLIGLPADLDGDGHLTIVVTAALDPLGTASGPVYGLTQPSDFIPEIDRPCGNQSDVIYLSPSLRPGNRLRAVLAHEWCHAAVFSKHAQRSTAGTDADADWLSEAIAHVVEVAVSDSESNIAHRVQSYLAQPAESPLIVENYCDPRYWRHKGCRGAGYLFLKWCLEEVEGVDLGRLASDQPLNLRSLEVATHQSFDRLFANWTASLGRELAAEITSQRQPSGNSSMLAHHTWLLEGKGEQTLTVRLKGTCADFVHIQCLNPSQWRITTQTSVPNKLQATLISVHHSAP